jgi:tetratricopeptide (TPR) repeat protein
MALKQSPLLDVLPDKQVIATLKLMMRAPDTRITPEIARELCRRANSTAYIASSISALGSQYVIGLKAVSCQSGDTLVQEQVTADSKEKVLNALGDAAAQLRGELGESIASVNKFNQPLVLVTTSSLEALQAFTDGVKALNSGGPEKAVPYHQRAVQLDPNFATAYLALATDYGALGESGRANEYYAKAFALRDHTSELERLTIAAIYYLNVTGEQQKAAETLQQLVEHFPREEVGYGNLGGLKISQGRFEEALPLLSKSIQLDPGSAGSYDNYANAAFALHRLSDVNEVVQRAQARGLADLNLHSTLYGMAFVQSDGPALENERRWFAADPANQTYGLALDADTQVYAGHLVSARKLTRQAVDSAISIDSKENGAIWLENAALSEAAAGNVADARDDVEEGLKLYPQSLGVQVEAALAHAMLGDVARAEKMAVDLNQANPVYTQVQALWLPAIHAQAALDRKDASAALEALQPAQPPLEYGQITFINQISCLYPTYVRGEAYLAAGRGKEAAAEFQRIVDQSGLVWNCWTGALSRLGAARGYAMEMRAATAGADAEAARYRARNAYKAFLALW